MTTTGGDDPSTLVQQSNFESLKQNVAEVEKLVKLLEEQKVAQDQINDLERERNRLQELSRDLTIEEKKELEGYEAKIANLM